jgi:beta-phosphoglucomutase-like phosphatase (HAD superfamily)
MKAYIFDLDGVLIDSEKMMNHAWTICQLEHNLDQPFSEYFKHIGKPFKDIMKELNVENACQVKSTYDKASLDLMDEFLVFYPEVENTLKKLKQGYKIAVVTSKTAERTKVILDKLEVEFDYVVSVVVLVM